MKIFWSWQDDLPGKLNRHFIKAALEEAVKAVEGDFELDDADRPTLDHDTKGIAGAAEIVQVVMEKIAASAVFVADVTPVAQTEDGKALPNPNVMVELGWSLHKPGWQRQIYVLNTADGWKISDLPFDIRGRRTLTYALADGASAATKAAVKKQLVADLTGAIRTNLTGHLEDAAAAQPITGVAAKDGESSPWATAGATFAHQDSFGDGHTTTVILPPGPRAYMRLIPSGWRAGAPDVAVIGGLDASLAVYAPSYAMSGDSGATREGYVRYSITSARDAPRESEDLAMYFEDTGEFWLLHGSAVFETKAHKLLGVDTTFQGWSTALRRAMWLFDRYGAFSARRVEVGLTGLDGVRWPGDYEASRPPARRPEVLFERQQRDWDAEAQEAFLIDALGKVRNLFAMPRWKPVEAAVFIKAHDRERGRTFPGD
jgi:hypothetical protein